jgi:hypothetical protein
MKKIDLRRNKDLMMLDGGNDIWYAKVALDKVVSRLPHLTGLFRIVTQLVWIPCRRAWFGE